MTKCPSCGKQIDARDRSDYNKQKYSENPESWRRRIADYREKHPDRVKKLYAKRRLFALQRIAGSEKPICVYCGCDDIRFLEINHKNGGGSKEFKKGRNSANFLWAIVTGRRKTDDLEVACRVCNALHYLKSKFGNAPFKVVWKP